METKEEPTGSRFEQLASALQNGLIVVDARGQVVWMDEATRGSVNGGLDDLKLPLSRDESAGADCFASAVDIRIHGQPMRLCILQEVPRPEDSSYELVAAVEAVMSDSSWFTRTMVEKFKAWRQTRQPAARSSDLEVLTSREREILALILRRAQRLRDEQAAQPLAEYGAQPRRLVISKNRREPAQRRDHLGARASAYQP